MITKRQKQVLDFVRSFKKKKGYSPSLEEIKKHLGLSSVSTCHYHIQALEALGYLRKKDNQPRTIDVYEKEQLIEISLLGKIAAGQPIEAVQDKESIAVPRNKFSETKSLYALRVVGDSMVDENINDGDIVLVQQQAVAKNGQRVVALLDGHEVTLKKYYKRRNHVELQPANKNLKSMIIKRNQDLLIQGVVLDVIKGNLDTMSSKHEGKKREKIGKKKIKEFVNRVIEGDCLEEMKHIPTRSIDMILCDLPYGTTQNNWDSLIPLIQL